MTQGRDPFQVGCAASESICEVNYLVNAAFSLAKLADGVRQIRRKVGVEQESHAG